MIARLAFVVVFIMMLLSANKAIFAHEGRPVYIEATVSGTEVQLLWKVPPVLETHDVPSVSIENKDCAIHAVLARQPLFGAVIYKCKSVQSKLHIKIDYPRSNPVLSTLLFLKSSDIEIHQLFGPDEENITVNLAGNIHKSFSAASYALIGAEHILAGYDHLLFVLCLVFLCRDTRSLIYAVTGFTVGHSLTLAVAVLWEVSVRPDFVEPMIAASIIILAREIILPARTLTKKYPVLVSGLFGLLHGLGFAGALSEIGLPEQSKILALFFFNVGVELGQGLVVAVVCLILITLGYLIKPRNTLYAKTAYERAGYQNILEYTGVRTGLVLPIGIIAMFWLLERV